MGTLSKAQEYDESSKKWHELTDTVSHCLSKEMVDLYIAVKQHSHGLVQDLNPGCELLSTKYVSALYKRPGKKLLLMLEQLSTETERPQGGQNSCLGEHVVSQTTLHSFIGSGHSNKSCTLKATIPRCT